MNVCPLCGAKMEQHYIPLDPFQSISRILNVLQCSGNEYDKNDCGYWVPCNVHGKVPLSRYEQEQRDE